MSKSNPQGKNGKRITDNSSRGSNVPVQPNVSKMPPVKPPAPPKEKK